MPREIDVGTFASNVENTNDIDVLHNLSSYHNSDHNLSRHNDSNALGDGDDPHNSDHNLSRHNDSNALDDGDDPAPMVHSETSGHVLSEEITVGAIGDGALRTGAAQVCTGGDQIKKSTSTITTTPPVSLRLVNAKYKVGTTDILKGVHLYLPPKRLLAVMGPSDAGKTTLLNVCAGKTTGGVLEGTCLYNGKPRSHMIKHFHRMVGYVEKDPLLLHTMTIR
jgi:ABC-type multidrug transport system fused ATPase/permease subunit